MIARIAPWGVVGLLVFGVVALAQGRGQGKSQDKGTDNAAAPIEIQGRAILVDLDGTERAEESGRVTVWVNTEHEGKAEEVRIERGRWTLTIPRSRKLTFSGLWLGGKCLLVGEGGFGEGISIPNDGSVTIRGKVLPNTTFRVVDAASGAELTDVDVVTGRDYPPENTIHPTGQPNGFETVSSKRPSPIDIRWAEGSETRLRYWVRAPGHAWATFEFEHKKGGEQLVKLAPAAELTVTWKGKAPAAAAIRIYGTEPKKNKFSLGPDIGEPDSRPHRRGEFQYPDAQVNCGTKDSIRITSLPPGEYIVAAEIGEMRRRPLVVDERKIELAAGANGPIELSLASVPKKTKASIAGVLAVPPGEATEELRVVVETTDALDDKDEANEQLFVHDMKKIVGKPNEYEWSLEDLPTGEYTIKLEPTAFEKNVVLTGAGLRDIRIEAPKRADVILKIVDDDTGKEVSPESVSWYPEVEFDFSNPDIKNHFHMNQPRPVECNKKSGVWEFAAYEGKVAVSVEAAGYARSHSSESEIHSGKNELTIRLAVGMGVRVRAIDKETRQAVGSDRSSTMFASADAVDHDGRQGSSSVGGEVCQVYVTKPGKYRIRLYVPNGYQKPKNKIVTVEKGKFLDVTFELEKK